MLQLLVLYITYKKKATLDFTHFVFFQLPQHQISLSSQAAVNLIYDVRLGEGFPIRTRLCHHLRELDLRDVIRAFQQIDIEPHAGVPCDVAVKGPYARVVRVDLNHDVA